MDDMESRWQFLVLISITRSGLEACSFLSVEAQERDIKAEPVLSQGAPVPVSDDHTIS